MKTEIDKIEIKGITYVPENSITQNTKVIELDGTESVWVIGKKYLVRTVTMIQLGELTRVTERELVMKNACWVADTGRFSTAVSTGELNEVEMFYTDVIISRGALVDAVEWLHNLPNKTK